jgi:hypothetical protein
MGEKQRMAKTLGNLASFWWKNQYDEALEMSIKPSACRNIAILRSVPLPGNIGYTLILKGDYGCCPASLAAKMSLERK